MTVRRGEGKRARLNGAPLRAAEQLRSTVSTLVFTPDRLGVVKGPPAARRAYFDRVLGRFAPARAPLPDGVRSRGGAEERGAAPRGCRHVRPRRDRAVERTRRHARSRARRGSPRDARRCSSRRSPSAPRARPRRRRSPVRRRAADARGPRGRARSRSRPRSDLARSAPRRRRPLSRRPRSPQLRLAGRAAARPARTTPRRGRDDRRPHAAFRRSSCSTTCCPSSIPSVGGSSLRACAAAGQALVTATDAAMLPADPDQLLEVTPGAAW